MRNHLFDGLRSLNGNFWKCFLRHPVCGFGFIVLAVVVFVYDLLYLLLTPTNGREGRVM